MHVYAGTNACANVGPLPPAAEDCQTIVDAINIFYGSIGESLASFSYQPIVFRLIYTLTLPCSFDFRGRGEPCSDADVWDVPLLL